MILNILFIVSFYILYFFVRITQLIFVLFRLFHIDFPRLFSKKNSLLFIENFPIENAGYHYRAGKWANLLNEKNFTVKVKTLIENKEIFDAIGVSRFKYLIFLLFSIIKKYYIICCSIGYERVIVRRELLFYNDYGNLFMLKFLLSIHPNAILDFDDDIGAAKREPRKIDSLFGKLLQENSSKFYTSLTLYKKFIVGSHFLKDLVLSYNQKINPHDICVIPTCVDYDQYPAKIYIKKEEIVFGWIGGNTNLRLLELLLPAMERISKSYKIKLLIISGKIMNPAVSFPVENRPWSLATEIKDMYDMDIGLMPLEDSRIAKGKCGFKLLQYMGLGIVSMATAITVNNEIISDEENSYLVPPNEDWEAYFLKVIKTQNFDQIGKNAKSKIHNYYTFTANINIYSDFLKTLCAE